MAGLRDNPVVQVAGGSGFGSGVVLASRLVLTCRHVIDPFDVRNDGFSGETSIQGIEVHGVKVAKALRSPLAARASASDAPDLALLVLQERLDQPPARLLLGPIAASLLQDQCRGWGFAGGRAELTPLRLEPQTKAEALLDEDHIGFLQATLEAGMSGGPILSGESRDCVGILVRGGLGRAASFAYSIRPIMDLLSREDVHKELESLSIKVESRHLLRDELDWYLSDLERKATALPAFYPNRLKDEGAASFRKIRQKVRVVQRETREQWQQEQHEREALRAAGSSDWRYDPIRSRPELRSLDDKDHHEDEALPELPTTFIWDEEAESDQYRRAILVGDPGMGKSWLLRHEVVRRVQQCREVLFKSKTDGMTADLRIPLWFKLPDLERRAGTLEERIRAELGSLTQRRATLLTYLLACFRNGTTAVLLDSWDECSVHREGLRKEIQNWAENGSSCPVLFASRGVRYSQSPMPEAPELELLAFERPEVECFARVWFGDEEDAKPFLEALGDSSAVNGLARIPLMLSFLCRVYGQTQPELPVRRYELYEAVVRGLLYDWQEDKSLERRLSPDEVEDEISQVAAVAYRLFPKESFGTRQVAEAAGLKDLPTKAKVEYVDILCLVGLLIAVDTKLSSWQLLHRTFHEYLTARYLAEYANKDGWRSVEAEVQARAPEPVWTEVIILLSGQLKDPLPLIDWLGKQEDNMQRPLSLAIRCLSEIDPGWVFT